MIPFLAADYWWKVNYIIKQVKPNKKKPSFCKFNCILKDTWKEWWKF